jgi:outer membrane protein
MKKILLLTALATSLSIADTVGGEFNLGYYSHTPSGTAENEGDSVTVDDVLQLSKENDMFAKVYLEHPIPIIPNFKVGYNTLSHSGSGESTQKFKWDGKNYKKGDKIDTKFDLTMYDFALYYELIDMLWINFDVGLNIKYIDGTVEVEDNKEEFDAPIPMLYSKVRLDIPTTDISLQVEGNYVTYDGNTLYDFEVGARYTLALGLGFEAGYKTFKVEVEDDDFEMETKFDGAYGKLVWDF